MRKHKAAAALLCASLLLLAGAGTASAQVKHIEMKIDGYLCGN
jgi:hypothetical protein